ncbi:hypothetical protein J4E86_010608 [Alternaria arbusti]|uniref:uncharacterized protein n=1 Tax=Alternaria arbusti TaxID=232088 RepID=UPI0022209160|nr:uncharacterized protein J4E86_010608 [Alternaria arbusti]KAI4941107.1 hypothetical protein J4E86_010608 [Alternaria arbusti]
MRGKAVLSKRQGCDLTFICDGVQFDVHTAFLLGGAETIEEYLHPAGNEQNPPRVTLVFNENDFSAIMVDRFVNFVYTNTYQLDKGGRARSLHHATYLPPGKSSDDLAVQLDSSIQFHLKMYNMGERLRYQELMTVAHAKLAEAMLWASRLTVELLLKILSWIYGSPGDETTKICMDQTGILRDMAVACTLRHIYRGLWPLQDVAVFENATQEKKEFREELRMAVDTYRDILKLPEKVKIGNKRKRRR